MSFWGKTKEVIEDKQSQEGRASIEIELLEAFKNAADQISNYASRNIERFNHTALEISARTTHILSTEVKNTLEKLFRINEKYFEEQFKPLRSKLNNIEARVKRADDKFLAILTKQEHIEDLVLGLTKLLAEYKICNNQTTNPIIEPKIEATKTKELAPIKRTPRKFDSKTLAKIQKQYESGMSVQAIAKKHNVKPQSIYNLKWTHKWNKSQSIPNQSNSKTKNSKQK